MLQRPSHSSSGYQGQFDRAILRLERRKQTTPLRRDGLVAYQLGRVTSRLCWIIIMHPAVPCVGRQIPFRIQIVSRPAGCRFGP